MNQNDRRARILPKIARWGVATLILMVGIGAWISVASAEGGTVRYSYEEVEVGGDRGYVLIPHADDRMSGEVNQRRLEQAFEALRHNKTPTYGNSYADVSGNVPEGGRVEVHIDSNNERFAPIIIAESVYTLTEFGIDEVYFPGFAEGGLTRADVSTPAYTLTIPLWKVTPPGPLTSAQVQMRDGELVSIDEINARWESDRTSLIDDVYAFLDTEEDYTRRQVLRILPDLDDLRLAEILPHFEHGDRRVRQEALSILEGMEDEEQVLEAVLSALNEESHSGLSRRMAEFLGASSIAQFNVQEQFYLIEHGDDEEVLEATERLAEWDGDERVVEQLAALLRDEREEVSMAAVASLDELQAHEVREEALDDGEVHDDVRLALADDLADEANAPEIRLVGLTYIAETRSDGYANQAVAEIGALPIDEAREQVEDFLYAEERSRRLAAVNTLLERGDVESVLALVEAAEEQPEQEQMEDSAYELMLSQTMDAIQDQTQAQDVRVQRVAFQAIGQRAVGDGDTSAAVLSAIEEGTNHSDASIRGAAARSLGDIGGDDALAILGDMTDDPDSVVRRDVARSLGQFDTSEHARTLVGYLEDDDPEVVAAAIDALQARNDQRAADEIDDMRSHDHPEIRASAIRAVTTYLLADEDDEDLLRRHMGMLSGFVTDDSTHVQRVALEQLGRFETSSAVTNIATRVGASEPDVRAAALRALASTGHSDARPLLERAVRDGDPEIRRVAIEALADLAGSQARPVLEAQVSDEEDPEVREFLEDKLQQI